MRLGLHLYKNVQFRADLMPRNRKRECNSNNDTKEFKYAYTCRSSYIIYNFTLKLPAKHFPKTMKILCRIKYGVSVSWYPCATCSYLVTSKQTTTIMLEYKLRLKICLKEKVFTFTTVFAVCLGSYLFIVY